uniref:Uncharacterized protein n=1 Tax=Panagrolaimus superbus TaxID=310955 RepID=A0A914XWJ7_9BILA
MSVLIESPMDYTFANTAFVSTASSSSDSGSSLLNSRKRKSQEIITDEFDFAFEPAPRKLLRREVSADDVRKLDVNWSFQMNPSARDNVDVSFGVLWDWYLWNHEDKDRVATV